MGWRTVVVDSIAKVSCKNGYLSVQGEEVTMIHLSEIDSLMIATTQATITAFALWQLAENKIRVIFCDEKHNPYGELSLYYGCHNSSKKLKFQYGWDAGLKQKIFGEIVRIKIINQANFLAECGASDKAEELYAYAAGVMPGDPDNKEGLAAKIYFVTLYGLGFSRDTPSSINAALDYGYAVILSAVNREVALNGCLSQLGLKHANEFNPYNFSCDLMEPFRIAVDRYVYQHREEEFQKEYKYNLAALITKPITAYGKDTTLGQVIKIFVKSVIDALNSGNLAELKLYEF